MNSKEQFKRFIGISFMLMFFCCIINVTAVKSSTFAEKRVTNIYSVSVTGNTVEFGWDAVSDVKGYEVWQLNRVTNGYDLLLETDKTKVKLEELNAGTKYTFLIRPYRGEDADREFGNFSNMFTIATTPGDVTNLQVVSTGSALVTLNWDKVSDDSSYLIYRMDEGAADYVQVGNVEQPSYTDNNVSPAKGYSYKVVSYVNDVNNQCKNAAFVITATNPESAFIKKYKGGDCRARLTWNSVSAGDGYIIYVKASGGNYVELIRLTDITAGGYTHIGLLPSQRYSFMIVPYKIYNGVEYKADNSNEVSVDVSGTIKTATKAVLYKTNKKLKKSAVYKKYKQFSNALVLDKSVIMPGVNETNVDGFLSKNMTTQAVAFAGKYMLVSAYDYADEENSVVYVIKRSTGKYITTLVLPDAYHVGGIAYDGHNVWVATGTAVSCFEFSAVKTAVASGLDSYPVSYKTRCEVDCQASFVSYYNNRIWVGEHKETSSAKMYGYNISAKELVPVLTKKYTMKIPSRTQDVEFVNKTTVIISRSNQVSSKKKYYISEMRKYKLDWSGKKKGTVKLKTCKAKITTPPMMEGVAYRKGYLYVSFESVNMKSCPHKMDRICALKVSKIKWKK